MKINEERMMKRIFEIGNIGKTGDGISREAFSKPYYKAVKKLKKQMEEEHLIVTVDKIGNIYGMRKGKSKGVIMIGSHLDTVKNGGVYDGNLGIQGGLECMAVLNDNNIETEHDIVIVGFNAEEGGPLGGTFGSRVALGNQSLEVMNIEEKLATCGLKIIDVLESKMKFTPKYFIELHIEQGVSLYKENIDIGIVEGIVGITRYKITINGEQNHAGTTLMKYRKDALAISGRLIYEIYEDAKLMEGPFVATVGKINIWPNFVNVIPGKVEFILELRDMEKSLIDDFVEGVRKKAENIEGYEIDFELYSTKSSAKLSNMMADIVEESCIECKRSYKRMSSGAGHDAMELSKHTETALIFIPSVNGISHNKEEFSKEEDIVNGVEIALKVIEKSDKYL